MLLQWLGDGRLAVPGTVDLSAWAAWAAEGDPLTVAITVLRLVALGLAWYLTGVTGISVFARVLRAARLVRVADALSFGPVRVLAQQAVGVGLAAGVVVTTVPLVPVASDAVAVGAADVAVMLPVGESGATAPEGLALREPVPAPVPAPTTASSALAVEPTSAASAAPTAAAPATPDTAAVGRERSVAPGDHFWSIAEDEVARRLGRAGSEAEVLAHWEVLVAANADRLVVRGNPDLLLPGQRLLLPEVAR